MRTPQWVSRETGTRRCERGLDVVGEEGFEPSMMDPESIALPLGYSPMVKIERVYDTNFHPKNQEQLTPYALRYLRIAIILEIVPIMRPMNSIPAKFINA